MLDGHEAHGHLDLEDPSTHAGGRRAAQDLAAALSRRLPLRLRVDPGARGSGAVDHLIDRVVKWARNEGMAKVRLHVTEGNHRAERAYERNGFTRTGTTVVRDRDGVVEVEMERRLV